MPRKKKVDARQERRTEIFQTVDSAMKALSDKKSMDWSRETPETIAAGFRLDEAMCDFIDGKATREDVKKAYKGYADLHVVTES